jgi:GntP family gluconate:H+ symporter
VIGGLSVIPGVAWAFYSNRRWPVPLRETPEVSLDQLRAQAAKDDRSLPPLGLALVPILLPVVLIIADVLYKGGPGWQAGAKKALGVLGNPNVALALSAAIALHMQLKFGAKDRATFTASLESSLGSAGQIILITAAGGAFGGVLQHTGIAKSIEAMFSGGGSLGVAVLVGAFLVTALIRVAQGSATVAMVTAIGMFAGLAKSGHLGYHPVYLALAIGFGSKPVPWMNDSGFWVVCKMSGQTVGETLRNHTMVFTIMGVSGLIFTVLAAKLFPFVP